MKKLTLLLTAILISFAQVYAAAGYEKAMKQAIESMQTASSEQEYMEVANKFERIGGAEKDQWLPYYYAAFCYTMLSTNSKDVSKMDEYLDKADEYLAQAEILDSDKVEVLVMKGFTAMMRITVDPATRGQEYSMKSVAFLQQAMQLDNKNPRVVLMLGQMQYGTAQFFGSGTEEACGMFSTSIELFEKEEEQGESINPSWGKSQAESMLVNCKG